MTITTRKILLITGVLFYIIPLFLLLLWIYACSITNGYPYNQQLYKSYFPVILQSRYSVSFLSIILIVIANIINIINLKNQNTTWKIILRIMIITGFMLLILNVFGIM